MVQIPPPLFFIMVKKSFSEKCYTLLRKVPRGRITTYREIAHALNCKSYRAVGTAMNKNPYGYPATLIGSKEKSRRSAVRGDSKRTSGFFFVPCHRVVKADGRIGKFASGTKNKIKVLKKEGIKIKNNKIVDFEKYLYKFN